MSDKLLSIIVLSWKRLAYITQTMESLIEKTTVPHEFILVNNDCENTSGVRDYLRSLEKKTNADRVVYVDNKKNLGVAGGRNSGIVQSTGSIIFNIDDDVLVCNNYDKLLIQACGVKRLGITGICVEPIKFPVKVIDGVRIRPKNTNLGGAALCMSRKIHNIVGYYRVFGQYSLEDSDMWVRLNKLGLMSAYIEPYGVHLDKDNEKVYRKIKDRAHLKGSPQMKRFCAAKIEYQKTGNVYVPHIEYDPDDPQWNDMEKINEEVWKKG